jgi:hypothetical protein
MPLLGGGWICETSRLKAGKLMNDVMQYEIHIRSKVVFDFLEIFPKFFTH